MSPDAGLISPLRLMLWLRWVWLAAWCVTLMVSVRTQPLLNWQLLALPLAIGFMMAILTALRCRSTSPVSRDEVFVQLAIDVALLSWLLVLSGGVTNPWITTYLLHLALAAWLLSARQLLFLLSVVVLAYTLMLNLPNSAHSANWPWQNYDGHLFSMWVNFVVSALLLVACLVLLRHWFSAQEQQLRVWQRLAAKRDQSDAISTLAASAVHELATPLNTLMLLVDDMPDSATVKSDLRQIAQRSRDIIANLREQAQSPERLPSQATESLLSNILAPLRERFPACQWSLACDDASAPLRLPWVLQLQLEHLLRNAQEAGADQVHLSSYRTSTHWCGCIQDNGPGFSAALLAWFQQGASEPWPSQKPGGLGMGLMLAAMAFNDHGGSVSINNDRGARVLWQLPLIRLESS